MFVDSTGDVQMLFILFTYFKFCFILDLRLIGVPEACGVESMLCISFPELRVWGYRSNVSLGLLQVQPRLAT